MNGRMYRKASYLAMVIAVAWLSLFAPACLAMGEAHGLTSTLNTCDCGSGADACLAHACAQLAGSTTYVAVKAVMAKTPNPQPLAPTPAVDWNAAIRHAAVAVPLPAVPPPVPIRSTNIRYCVYLK